MDLATVEGRDEGRAVRTEIDEFSTIEMDVTAPPAAVLAALDLGAVADLDRDQLEGPGSHGRLGQIAFGPEIPVMHDQTGVIRHARDQRDVGLGQVQPAR